nr:2112_t:CDS:2 [Entrophospora candida]
MEAKKSTSGPCILQLQKKVNKSIYGAKCKACIKNLEPIISVKMKKKKRKIINIDDDEVNELQSVSVASSSKSIYNTIQFCIPRKLSEGSQKQWKRLVLGATISCGWSFNCEAMAMLNFANKGLNLPKRKIFK